MEIGNVLKTAGLFSAIAKVFSPLSC